MSAVRSENLGLRSAVRITTHDGLWHVTYFGVLLRETTAL